MTTTITFIGHGAGDMAVIDCDDGTSILIDAGVPEAARMEVIPALFMALEDPKIDYFIPLGYGAARLDGLRHVVEKFRIAKVLDTDPMVAGEDGFLKTYRLVREQAATDDVGLAKNVSFGKTQLLLMRTAGEKTRGAPVVLRVWDDSAGMEAAVMFASDTSAPFWARATQLLPAKFLKAHVLVAGGHGGQDFFLDGGGGVTAEHLNAIDPQTIVIGEATPPAVGADIGRAAYGAFAKAGAPLRQVHDGAIEGLEVKLSSNGVQIEGEDDIALDDAAA